MEMINASSNYILFYEFKDTFESVWSVIKDVRMSNRLTNYIEKNLTTDPVFIRGSSSWEPDSVFTFIWKNIIKIYFRVEEVIETDYYCKVKWTAFQTEPKTIPYVLIRHLHKIDQEKCMLGSQLIFSSKYYLPKEEAEKENFERWKINNIIDLCIHCKEQFKYQEESIIILSDIKLVWKMLKNMKLLHRLVPCICDKVEYEGEELQISTILSFIWENSTNKEERETVQLEVKKITAGKKMCELVYESCDISPQVPRQRVRWMVSTVEGGNCYLLFLHIFSEPINPKILYVMSSQKAKILKRIKLAAEKHSKILISTN